jgi:hypothetical protein
MSAAQPGAVDPGYTTTEFWQTLLVSLISAAVAIASLVGTNFNLDGVQAVVPAVAVAAAAVAQLFYSNSRSKVKIAAQQAAAQAATMTGGSPTAAGYTMAVHSPPKSAGNGASGVSPPLADGRTTPGAALPPNPQILAQTPDGALLWVPAAVGAGVGGAAGER